MNAAVRKLENNVATLGLGVAAFGAWTFVKLALFIVIVGIPFEKDIPDKVQMITTGILWVIIALYSAAFLYVGLSARGDGMGKPKSPAYLVFTALLICLVVVSIISEVVSAFSPDDSVSSLLIYSLFDVISLAVLLDMFISAIRLRKLRKELRHES